MREQPERAWHNVRPNETSRQPRRHIFIDTESRSARRGKTGRQTWRLAVACYSIGRKGADYRDETKEYKDTRRLWEDVTDFADGNGRTILWAHNLGYDVRIAGLFMILPSLGWRLTGHNITPRTAWLEWKRDSDTLLMVDSVALFNTTLAKVGEWFGLGKLSIDMDSDSDRDWFTRCHRDVAILALAVKSYLQWLEDSDMGNWQITGAAQSWATFRHRFLTHKLTVHDNEDALRAERRAMWTGRCEAYWRGEIKDERVHEFDFKAAYPRIARDYRLPTTLIGPMPSGYDWHRLLSSQGTALLGRVRVDSPLPVVPTERNGRILWPTGTFETTLWDVEIKAALDAGATVTMLQGWFYRKTPALQAWGTWILEQLARPDNEVPAWQKAILKHWSRALIGRFAMTYNQWTEWGEMPTPNALRSTVWDKAKGETYEIMQVGNTVWQDVGRTEWQNSMPCITGYVQAIGRVHLWNFMQLLPPRTFIYVDTDSILTTGKYFDLVGRAAANFTAGELRPKRAWDGFAVYGPRQIVTGEQVRISGVPRVAKRTAKHVYEGEVWDSLVGAMRKGGLDSVITRDRTWRVNGVDHRRNGTGFGWTEPINVELQEPATVCA